MRKITKEIFGNYPKDVDTLKKLLGREWKKQIEYLKRLAETYRYYPKNKLRTVHLSIYGSRMTRLFKYHQKASRVVKTAMSIGMMALVSNDVRFNCKEPRSRTFLVNHEVVELILNVPVESSLFHNVYNTPTTTPTTPTTTLYNNDTSGSKEEATPKNLNDLEFLNISIDSFRKDMRLCDVEDSVLVAMLYRKYPQLIEYAIKSQQINCNYENDSIFTIHVRPTIKRHGMQYVTFGCRPYSDFCSIPKKVDDSNLSRTDVLTEKFGTWTEYDVKSSIYRVTYAINNGGKWLDDDIDLYREFIKGDFKSTEARDNFKKICMLVYFNQSDLMTVKSIMNPTNEVTIPEEWNKDDTLAFVKDLRETMHKLIGKFYGSEIFVHEGCVYMDVLDGLQKLGMDAVEIYDCFYVQGNNYELAEACNKLIVDSIGKYVSRYVNV